MGLFRFNDVHPSQADTTNALLGKILQRLNDSSSASPTEPATNVAVVNAPLTVEEINPLTEIDVGNFPATQDVHVTQSVPIAVSNFPATQPVSGSVAVTNFPASQNVVVTNAPSVAVNNFPEHQPVHIYDSVTNDPVTVVGGHLSTLSVPHEFEISEEGNYDGREAYIWRLLGRRAGFNSTSVLQDVGEWLATSIDSFPVLTGAETLELVSSSTADDNSPGGTGTRTVRIVYLDTSYAIQSVDYPLNGTVPVVVAESMRFVYWMEALTGGTSEVSEGNIDLRISGGGAIHERITAGGNRSLSARFMVPDGFTGYIRSWAGEAINTTQDMRLRATMSTYDQTLSSRYVFQATMYLGASGERQDPLPWVKIPARCRVKVSTIPGAAAAGNRVGCNFDVLLIAD
jgi:hypothetical protein